MPPVAVALATAAIAIGAQVAIAAGVSAIIVALVTIAATVAITLLAKKPKTNKLNQGAELKTKIQPDMPRQVLVGAVATGGSCHFTHTRTDQAKKPNRFLYRVIQISDQPLNSLVEVREGKTTLTFSGDVTTGWRSCNQHLNKDGAACMWIRVYLGSFSAVADATLVSDTGGIWSNSHKGTGLAYAIVKYDYDADAHPNGEPELTFVVQGAKLYDDRKDSTVTGGSGSHRLNDYATWEYSDTCSIIIAQYLRGFKINDKLIVGVQADAQDLSTTMIFSAHNTCEQLINYSGGTEKRYAAGMIMSTTEPASDHLVDLQAAMDGKIFDRGGAITILPGANRTPVLNLADQDIVWTTEKSWQPKASLEQMLNHITANFVDAGQFFQERDLPVLANAQWELDDGGERFSEFFSFRAINRWSQGQRICKRLHTASRYSGTVAFVGGIWLLEMEQGDWFTLTSPRWGMVTKYFEIQEIVLTRDIRVAIVGREVHPNIDGWDHAVDEKARTDTSWNPPIYTLPVPAFTTAALTLTDAATGKQSFGVTVTLTDTTTTIGAFVTGIEIQYAPSSNLADTKSGGTFTIDQGKLVVSPLLPSTAYSFRLRTTDNTRTGVWSSWVEQVTGVAILTPIEGIEDLEDMLTELFEIGDDSVLATVEKQSAINLFAAYTNEKAGLEARANALGITTEKSNYTTAYNALNTYLTGLAPAWNDTTQNTDIVRATWRTKWQDVSTTREALWQKISLQDRNSNRGVWATDTTYYVGDFFIHDGTGYQVITQHLSAGAPPNANVQKVSAETLAELDTAAAAQLAAATAFVDAADNDGFLTYDEKFRDVWPALTDHENRFMELMRRADAVGLGPLKHNELSADIHNDWSKTNVTTTANAALNPFGEMTATKVVHNSAGAAQRIAYTTHNLSGARYVAHGICARYVHGFQYMRINTDAPASVWFDLQTGEVVGDGLASSNIVRKGSILLNNGMRLYYLIEQAPAADAAYTVAHYFSDQIDVTSTAGFTAGEVHIDRPQSCELDYLPAFWNTTAPDTAPVAGNAIADAVVVARAAVLDMVGGNLRGLLGTSLDALNDGDDASIVPFDTILSKPNDLSVAPWVLSNATLARDLGFWELSDSSSGVFGLLTSENSPLTYAPGTKVTLVAKVRKDAVPRTTRFPLLRITQNSNGDRVDLRVDTQTGLASVTSAGLAAPTDFGCVSYDTNTWLVWVTGILLQASTIKLDVYPAAGAAADWTYAATAIGDTSILLPQLFVGSIAERARDSLGELLGAWGRTMETLANLIGEREGTTGLVIKPPSSDTIIACDYLGVIKTDELARDVAFVAEVGLATVTTTSAWSRTQPAGITCTIGAATGILNITSMTATEVDVPITCVYNGVTRTTVHKVKQVNDPPPTGGSGGGAGPTASDSTLGSVNSTTPTVISNVLEVVPASTTATLNAPLSARRTPKVAGTYEVNGKWQRNVASVWTDISPTNASNPDNVVEVVDPESGVLQHNPPATLTVNTTESVTVGVAVEFRFLAWNTTGTQNMAFTGTVSVAT